MKILIAVDMEGCTGIVNWNQVTPGTPEYQRCRHLMTGDVNAAILGAYEGGATEVTVVDGHWNADNILVEELDRRARLYQGTGSPLAMVEGVQNGVDGALFVGYHARAGSQNAILDHTWSFTAVANLWLNDTLAGETALNGAVAGHYGVPVLMVSGDQTCCLQALELLGDVEVASVKKSSGHTSAECLPPEISQEKICDAAARAVLKLGNGKATAPYRLTEPVRVAVEFHYSGQADKAAILPDTQRTNGRTIAFSAADMVTAYRAFRAAVALSNM